MIIFNASPHLCLQVWLYPTNFRETFCNTALEMMMGRVLTIATDVGALSELLRDGRGFLIPTDENGQAAFDVRVLAQILDDPPRLEATLDRALRWAEGYTWNKRSSEWLRRLKSIKID